METSTTKARATDLLACVMLLLLALAAFECVTACVSGGSASEGKTYAEHLVIRAEQEHVLPPGALHTSRCDGFAQAGDHRTEPRLLSIITRP